jgi:hypothetical protein
LVRLSNGFSRKIENHLAAVAINYFAYNFIKIHRALRVTPAMEAGIVSRPFDGSDKRGGFPEYCQLEQDRRIA